MSSNCRSCADFGGRCAGSEAGWRVSVERPGRSRAVYVCRGFDSAAHGTPADLWHLSRTSAHRHRARRKDFQAEVRPPRWESSGETIEDWEVRPPRWESSGETIEDWEDRDHGAQP